MMAKGFIKIKVDLDVLGLSFLSPSDYLFEVEQGLPKDAKLESIVVKTGMIHGSDIDTFSDYVTGQRQLKISNPANMIELIYTTDSVEGFVNRDVVITSHPKGVLNNE